MARSFDSRFSTALRGDHDEKAQRLLITSPPLYRVNSPKDARTGFQRASKTETEPHFTVPLVGDQPRNRHATTRFSGQILTEERSGFGRRICWAGKARK